MTEEGCVIAVLVCIVCGLDPAAPETIGMCRITECGRRLGAL